MSLAYVGLRCGRIYRRPYYSRGRWHRNTDDVQEVAVWIHSIQSGLLGWIFQW